MNNTNQEKSERTAEILDQTARASDEHFARKKAETQAAEANLPPDKQPFDADELRTHYSMLDDAGMPIEDEAWMEDLRHQYYIKHPDVKTMAEFAAKREELDGHNVN